MAIFSIGFFAFWRQAQFLNCTRFLRNFFFFILLLINAYLLRNVISVSNFMVSYSCVWIFSFFIFFSCVGDENFLGSRGLNIFWCALRDLLASITDFLIDRFFDVHCARCAVYVLNVLLGFLYPRLGTRVVYLSWSSSEIFFVLASLCIAIDPFLLIYWMNLDRAGTDKENASRAVNVYNF